MVASTSGIRRIRLSARPAVGHRLVLVLAGLTALAGALRFSTLGAQSYWYDEAITVGLVRRSFHEMLAELPHTESTPPLYYVLAWAWARVFGTGEVGLRSLSAIFGTLTVPAAFAAAKSFVSSRPALVTAVLVGASPLLVWYSQEARAYALLVFLGTVSLAFLGRSADRNAGGALIGWTVASSLALMTHYFAAFLILPEAVWLIQQAAMRRAAKRAVSAVGVVGVALVPLALYQARYAEHTAWISNSGSLAGRAAYFMHQLVVGAYSVAHIRPLVAAVPLVLLIGLFSWTDARDRAGARLALAFGIVAVAAPLVVAAVGDRFFSGRGDYFIYRNVILATIPLTIVAGAVAGARRAGIAGTIAVVAASVLLAAVSVEIARDPSLQRPDLRAVAAALRSPASARAVVADVRASTVLMLYLDGEVAPPRGVRVREIDVVGQPGSPPTNTSPRHFRRSAIRRIQSFSILRLRASRVVPVRPANLVRQLPQSRQVVVLYLSNG